MVEAERAAEPVERQVAELRGAGLDRHAEERDVRLEVHAGVGVGAEALAAEHALLAFEGVELVGMAMACRYSSNSALRAQVGGWTSWTRQAQLATSMAW